MGFFTRQNTVEHDKPIFAFTEGIRTPHSATITGEFISPNKDGNKSFPAGMFIAVKNGRRRLLPRAKVTVAAVSGQTRFKTTFPYTFIPGDELTIVEPYIALTVSGTGMASILFNERMVQVTPIGAGTATEAASQLATLFSETLLNDYFRFVAAGTSLYVFAKDGMSLYTVTGSGSLSAGGALTVNTTPIGTVSFIDTMTEEIVLNAGAGLAVPVGFNVGVKVDYVVGILPTSGNVSNVRPSMDVGVADEGKLWLGALPYYDGDIERQVPRLVARMKW